MHTHVAEACVGAHNERMGALRLQMAPATMRHSGLVCLCTVIVDPTYDCVEYLQRYPTYCRCVWHTIANRWRMACLVAAWFTWHGRRERDLLVVILLEAGGSKWCAEIIKLSFLLFLAD